MTKKSVQQKEPAEERQWLVKNEQAEVFGPVGLEVLREWARDGRLSPMSVVSEDAAAWSPVASLPGLGMDWVAEVSPGVFYGPIHHQALKELQKNGTIAPAAVLFARDAGPNARHPAGGSRAEAAETALAECVGQAEEAQKWLTAQVAQLTAQLAERDAKLRCFEQQATDVNMLQLLAQEIITAQEMGTRQVLEAVADAQAAVAGQSEAFREMTLRQVADRKVILDAVAATPGKVSADVTRELAQGRQVVLEAFSDARTAGNKVVLDAFSGARKEIAAQVVQEVSAKLPPPAKEGLAADAQVKAVEHVGQALRDAVATLVQDVHDVKAGQGQVAAVVGDTVAPLTRQVQQLSEEVQSLGKTLAEAAAKAPAQTPGPKVERVYVEAEAVEVIPPLPQPSAPHETRAKPKAPSSPKAAAKAADLPPGMNGAGGLSMAELEQQAQRELERLGAQGVNLFKRTK